MENFFAFVEQSKMKSRPLEKKLVKISRFAMLGA